LGFDGSLTVIGDEAHYPYQRPPLSKLFLAGKLDRNRIDLRLDEGLAGAWRLNVKVRQLDLARRVIELSTGEVLPFDGLVCATGSEPRTLSFAQNLEGVFTLRTVEDALSIKARISKGVGRAVIVGAGFIGCEVAATLRSCGLKVTVIDIDRLPMLRVLNEPLAQLVLDMHRKAGVDFQLQTAVEALEGSESVEAVRLSNGRVIAAELVIIAIGVRPSVGWLVNSGIRLEDGIVCDERCAVLGTYGIVAAGDVARWHNPLFGQSMRVEHWDNAIAQGEAAAHTLLQGTRALPFASVPFFWSDQYSSKFQMAGMSSLANEFRVIEGSLNSAQFIAAFLRDERLVGVFGCNAAHRIHSYIPLIESRSPLPEVATFG
jgi:NADPH-dependent 2,4-dienoyl-CoA reductase/sulfur reductase-like enzyme